MNVYGDGLMHYNFIVLQYIDITEIQMKKQTLIYVVLFVAVCAAVYFIEDSGDKASSATLDQTITSSDGMLSLSVPRNWYNDEELAKEQGRLLSLNNYATLWVDVYRYEEDTLDDYTNYLKDFYGDNIVGDVKRISIDGANAAMLEYRFIGTTTDNMEALYHGYEYIVETPDGIVELDAYRTYDDAGTNEAPTDIERLILKRIAESLNIS